jgi:hypothetical protein
MNSRTAFEIHSDMVRALSIFRSDVKTQRYNPWRLAMSACAALALFVFVTTAAYQFFGVGWAIVAAIVSCPVPIIVVLWVRSAWDIEEQRLAQEYNSILRFPTAMPDPPKPEAHLDPGMLIGNSRVVHKVPTLGPEKERLRDACLKLVRLGMEHKTWSRSALAEGEKAFMGGDEWDDASKELQRLGWFWVPGQGKGLRPRASVDLDVVIARLEAAI